MNQNHLSESEEGGSIEIGHIFDVRWTMDLLTTTGHWEGVKYFSVFVSIGIVSCYSKKHATFGDVTRLITQEWVHQLYETYWVIFVHVY